MALSVMGIFGTGPNLSAKMKKTRSTISSNFSYESLNYLLIGGQSLFSTGTTPVLQVIKRDKA
jgi:hypothetical protein